MKNARHLFCCCCACGCIAHLHNVTIGECVLNQASPHRWLCFPKGFLSCCRLASTYRPTFSLTTSTLGNAISQTSRLANSRTCTTVLARSWAQRRQISRSQGWATLSGTSAQVILACRGVRGLANACASCRSCNVHVQWQSSLVAMCRTKSSLVLVTAVVLQAVCCWLLL